MLGTVSAIECGECSFGKFRHDPDGTRKFLRHRLQGRWKSREQTDPVAPRDRLFDHRFIRLQHRYRLLLPRHRLERPRRAQPRDRVGVLAQGRLVAEGPPSELRATGETARKRDPGTIGQLTPQELQIAELVAEGRSNKDVAAQLFLSPRTVEYHLYKVFAKLGIASRSELIRKGVGTARRGAAVP